MQALIIVLIVLAGFILTGIGVLIFATWRNRYNDHILKNLSPENYGELNKLSSNLQEKLPVLNSQVETVVQTLNSQSAALPVMENKIDTLQKTNATEASVKLLKENLTRLEELTNKLDKKAQTIEVKADKNAAIDQQRMSEVNDHLGKISTIDQKIANNLNVSMTQTKMIPTLDTKVETIKQHTSDISAIKETLSNLNQLLDGLNKTTTSISSRSDQYNDQNLRQLHAVQREISDLTKIFINDRNRGRSGEIILENFLGNYFGVKGENRLWSTQYKITNINNPHQEIGLVDAVIFTPHQNQNIAIDAKFPALDYKKIFDENGQTNLNHKKEFEAKVKSKIKDLKKYIHPDNQIASVIMFIPSENIYYFIADQCPELMDYAYQENIWLAGPTILMAILTSQSQVISEHYFARNVTKMRDLILSLKDEFQRFDERAHRLKNVHDKYVKDSDNAFKTLAITQNKIVNKVDKLETLKEDEQTLESEAFIEVSASSAASALA